MANVTAIGVYLSVRRRLRPTRREEEGRLTAVVPSAWIRSCALLTGASASQQKTYELSLDLLLSAEDVGNGLLPPFSSPTLPLHTGADGRTVVLCYQQPNSLRTGRLQRSELPFLDGAPTLSLDEY